MDKNILHNNDKTVLIDQRTSEISTERIHKYTLDRH